MRVNPQIQCVRLDRALRTFFDDFHNNGPFRPLQHVSDIVFLTKSRGYVAEQIVFPDSSFSMREADQIRPER
jgi:hypothetical protein